MNEVLLHVYFSLLQFLRNPVAAFFSIVFPLGFYVLVGSLFKEAISAFTPNIIVFTAVFGSYSGLAIGTVQDREEGVLKRLRGTPLRPWRYLLAKAAATVVVIFVIALLLLVTGLLAFGLQLPRLLPLAAVTLLVGLVTLSLLALATTVVIPNVEATAGVTNAVAVPLLFASGTFLPIEMLPGWVVRVAAIFPVPPLGRALRATFDPGTLGLDLVWRELAVVAIWGIGELVLAARYFRWQPWPPKLNPAKSSGDEVPAR
jgi:ABC-2 type transport system permease protein